MKNLTPAANPKAWITYKRLFSYIHKHWFVFIIAIIGSIGYSAVDAWLVKFLQPMIDEGLVARDDWFIRLIPIMLPTIFFIRGLMSFTSDYSMDWLGRHMITEIRRDIFRHWQKLPATFYDHYSSGNLLSQMLYNTTQVAQAVTDVIIDSVRNLFLIIFLIGVMLWTNWQLTLAFAIVGPFIITIFVVASRRLRRLSRGSQDAIADMTHVAKENIENYHAVRIFGGEPYEIQQFNKAVEKTRRFEMKNYLTRGITVPAIQILGGAAFGLTVYVAMNYLTAEELTAGAFATLAAAMISLLKPLKELTNVTTKIQKGIAAAEAIFNLLDQPPETNTGTLEIERVKGGIEFKHVTFSYMPESPIVLNDFNLSIKPGQRIALLGRSGAGKSTVTNLLTGFYSQYQGKMTIDDHDIRDFSLKSLRKQFAVVTQRITLFSDTIANNITYGAEHEHNEERLREAAKAAHALEFIERLPDGFNSLVGENGVLLSGGQRQRLAIARAIYKDAPILILDEATSALDTESERHIQVALDELMQNRTSLIIAHRLSTVERADLIVVLENGKMVEKGTHTELMALNGHYTQLRSLQML